MLRLFAGLGHLFIVCQREEHHVKENLEHVFRSLSTTLHSYTFHSHSSFGEYRFAYLSQRLLADSFIFPVLEFIFFLSYSFISLSYSFIFPVHLAVDFQSIFNMSWRVT